jgi:uncharacterized protein (DUF427 family)
MKEKQIKLPGPDHPISILRNPARVVVSVAGRVVADTRNALTLREAAYPPVQYIPREDVDSSQLKRTDHATYCPYKGDCNYYSVPAGGRKSVNAVWSYEDPFPAVAQIRGHVAFYPDRVDEIAEQLPTNDATLPWPLDRQQVDAGTLTIDGVESDDTSPARDINFDPLVLPNGIAASDDPMLSARSAAYSVQPPTRRIGQPGDAF